MTNASDTNVNTNSSNVKINHNQSNNSNVNRNNNKNSHINNDISLLSKSAPSTPITNRPNVKNVICNLYCFFICKYLFSLVSFSQ